HALVRKLSSGRAAAISNGKNYGRGACTCRKRQKKRSTGPHQHRGRLADRILARAVRKRLGHRISAAGTYSHVRQRDVPSRESDAAIRHHDDSGRGDRETHRRRIRRSSAGHRSHASSEHIETGSTGSQRTLGGTSKSSIWLSVYEYAP